MLLEPVVLVLAVLVDCLQAQIDVDWVDDASRMEYNYNIQPGDPFGFGNWHSSYTDTCAGNLQSPVDIETRFARYNPNLICPAILYKNSLVKGRVENTGVYLRFRPDDPNSLTVENAPYRPGKYVIRDFHIHCGGLNDRKSSTKSSLNPGILHPGSEHKMDGTRQDGEVHFTFKNSRFEPRDFSVFSEEDGIVVVAIFVKVLPDSRVRDLRFSRYLQDAIPSVLSINESMKMTVDPGMFFGSSCDFYTYQGSLTTPFCGESVRFVIHRNPVYVTRTAWYQLSRLQSRGNFVRLYGNYRNEQPLNKRIIETNIPPSRPIV